MRINAFQRGDISTRRQYRYTVLRYAANNFILG